jgi:hypothetical protein
MGLKKFKKHLAIFNLKVSYDLRIQRLGPCYRVWWKENKFDVGKLHFWMTRSVVEKNKGLPVLNLHFGIEFLKIFQKYHSYHPCFGICLPDDSMRQLFVESLWHL